MDGTRAPAEQPVAAALLECVRALTGSSDLQADGLATAIAATARGFALPPTRRPAPPWLMSKAGTC